MPVSPDCNFVFLEEGYPHLAQSACIAETCLYSDPHNSIIKIGLLNEEICRIISIKSDIKLPKPYSFRKVLNNLKKHFFTDDDVRTYLKIEEVAKSRNMAAHNLPRSEEAYRKYTLVAENTLIAGYSISTNFYSHFIDPAFSFPEFRMPRRLGESDPEEAIDSILDDETISVKDKFRVMENFALQADKELDENAGRTSPHENRREMWESRVEYRNYEKSVGMGTAIGGLGILGSIGCALGACVAGIVAAGSAIGTAVSAGASAVGIGSSAAGTIAMTAGKATGVVPASVNQFFKTLDL